MKGYVPKLIIHYKKTLNLFFLFKVRWEVGDKLDVFSFIEY